jgi:hypothetical protein
MTEAVSSYTTTADTLQGFLDGLNEFSLLTVDSTSNTINALAD